MDDIRLTQYSHGAGCGCKISPERLDNILQSSEPQAQFANLLVGNESRDDAAAFDLGNGTSVLSTTDFFMPIVDDPFTFGRIAATNAISDIYAMGGTPLMAIAIFGWPINKLSDDIARAVIEGGRAVCKAANIPLAGGHSIDAPEPIFGLAVTGTVENQYLKHNDKATPNCELFLTKPLGIGIISTAQKQSKVNDDDLQASINTMTTLNTFGSIAAKIDGVTAITDVTGFGLLGHLLEMCKGSHVHASITFDAVPKLDNILKYQAIGCVPGGTGRNFESYGHLVSPLSDIERDVLCDAQTSGGLLIAVEQEHVNTFLDAATSFGLQLHTIGHTHEPVANAPYVTVK